MDHRRRRLQSQPILQGSAAGSLPHAGRAHQGGARPPRLHDGGLQRPGRDQRAGQGLPREERRAGGRRRLHRRRCVRRRDAVHHGAFPAAPDADARLHAPGPARRHALRRRVGVTTHLDQGGFPFTVPLVGNPSDGAADFDRYRAHDSVRTLSQQGELTNRIWTNFLHVEEKLDTPELMARLLNSWNDFGGDMLHVLGIGEFTADNFLAPGTPTWMNGTRLVAQAQWRNENHSLNFPVFALPGLPLDWKVIIDGWQTVHDELTDPANPNRIPEGIKNLRWVLAHVPVITPDYLQKLKKLGGGVN